ncbi:Sarcosine oxidase alpha subunit [Granulibacter bethesdensis]|uniref:Sarcosine oxidase alpha subunit n=1 Tax=Granulibacter bethesdensis TaxID=364410 RepID=A0AAC9K9B6_9PROT|nr:sarcosine oxidase subunit alpha family protein [Granulibacter bethesdensis]APH53304.1 Sarcosine oxidase alpha subunit [Granulibacter bethesdensis]APH60879.1 Sarcosine oxidase alpha subunit [Granulibacter bethesdensis]
MTSPSIHSAPFRLPQGGRIRRDKPLSFTFDGKTYQGAQGDTLASALLANGVHLMGRSFKYHRPRGVLSAGADEPNALVGVGAEQSRYTPNLRATQVELYDGLVAESQNRNPSLSFDIGAINNALGPFFPAGFYYKTFKWPRKAWDKLYEPVIRRAAGLGKAPTAPDADHYAQRYAHCDVLIVGAGPAGLAAALAAADAGARVILCDEQSEMGGSLLAPNGAQIDGKPAELWLSDTLAQLAADPRVTLLPRTTAFGYYAHNFVGLAQRITDHLPAILPNTPRERMWHVRAGQVVLATGSLERPLVFPENDRPGIMLADSARIYAQRYGVKPGTKAVITTANDEAYSTAVALAKAGVEIAAIADLREHADGERIAAARDARLPIRMGSAVIGTGGHLRVSSARIGGKQGRDEHIRCDLVLMCGGFTPTVHLFSQSRGQLVYDAERQIYVPGTHAEHERSAGACAGHFGLAVALEDGYSAGLDAAKGGNSRIFQVSAPAAGTGGFIGEVPHNRRSPYAKAFVDFQNDATAKDIKLAVREGFRSIEHVKRYTTTGMATDQGKTSNMNALGIVSGALDTPVPQIGLTTFRPPYTPVTFGSFAGTARGDLFDPLRKTPIHSWAEEHGAVFEDVGIWKRARYFPQDGEDMDAAVLRECARARAAAGIFDASTLGKIEVVGPDAAEFLNRLYVNAWDKLKPGKCRYGLLLREDGFITDDGVIGRIAQDRFHVTTTTSGAPRVLAMMEDYRQTEWPELNVWLTSTTEQWAVIAVQGPKARDIIAPLIEGVDLSDFAHMSVADATIAGVPGRLFRVSFTGELGYELNVPADYGRAVWEAVYERGQAFGIVPYGTETMHVLRAEKGYVIVGQETDGTATPDDVGLAWAIGKAKKDFVGKRSLERTSMKDPNRKQLVGLLTDDPTIVLEEGAQIVADPAHPLPMPMIGHVTSAYRSATLGRSIALAMIKGGRSRIGQTVYIPMPGRTIAAKITEFVFYDPEGVRLNG